MSSFRAPAVMNTVRDAIDNIPGKSLVNTVSDTIDSFSNTVNTFADELTSLFDEYTEVFDVGLSGFIQNVIEATGGSVKAFLDNILPSPLSDSDFKLVNAALEVGDVNSAAVIMANNSVPDDASDEQFLVAVAQYENILSLIDITVSGQIVFDQSNTVFPKTYNIGSNQYQWSGAASEDYDFSYISSIEELQAELRSITREITEVVVHWSDSYTNKHLTAEQIHDGQIAVGIDGIGYHYVIRRDGTLQRGRPAVTEGQHSANHNKRSIAICFVGGYNCPTGTEDPTQFLSAASLTREQMTTFDLFCGTFFVYYPGGQILGHNDIEPQEIDPGFDVIDYCRTRFNKVSLFNDPSSQLPFTTAEINDSSVLRQSANIVSLELQR